MEEFDKSPEIITDEAQIEESSDSKLVIIENGKQDEFCENEFDASKLLKDLNQARKDKKEVDEDREGLLRILERKNLEIERLENTLKQLKEQLADAHEAKYEAIIKYDEILHKSKQIDFKEKMFEEDRKVMETQIQTLTADLNRNIQELHQLRKDSMTKILTLESKFHEKTEELNISNRQLTQITENNASLTSQVEELSEKILKFNENYASTLQKYQQEMKSKTRLSELYKEKNDEVINEQKNLEMVVNELRAALKQATDEFGALETSSRQKEVEFEKNKDEMTELINNLNFQLKNIRKENIVTSIEKLISPTAFKRLSGKSLTEIFTLYVQTSDQLEELSFEHEQLKTNFAELVHEIKEKGPEIQKTQFELEALKNSYETLKVKYDVLHRERLESGLEMEVLVTEIQQLRKCLLDAQKDRKELSKQICYMLEKGTRRDNGDLIAFDSIEELQDNNIKLVALVRDLSAAIEKLESEQLHSNGSSSNSIADKSVSTQTEDDFLNTSRILQRELAEVKNDFEKYRKDKEEMSNQYITLKDQFNEISSLNFKLKTQVDHQQGQLKLQQKNVEMYKNKIQISDERLQTSITTNARLETILTNVNSELRNLQMELNNTRRRNESLTQQNQNLLKSEARLKAESEVYNQQNQLQSHMMSSLEFIKNLMERSENDNRVKLEEHFQETFKAQLEEERSQFREYEDKVNETLTEKEEELTQLREALAKFMVETCDSETQYEDLLEEMYIDDGIFKSRKRDRSDGESDEDNDEKVVEKRFKISLNNHNVKIENPKKCIYYDW